MDALATGLGDVLAHAQDLGAAPWPSRAEAEAAMERNLIGAGGGP